MASPSDGERNGCTRTTCCTVHASSCTAHRSVIRGDVAPGAGWDPGAGRRDAAAPRAAREEREHRRDLPAGRPPLAAVRRSRSRTSTGCAGGSTACAHAATRAARARSASASPPTSPPPRSASPAGAPPSRRSPTPRTCRSAPGATTSPRRCATHQVVVVAGETGSGKTTQLPKIAARARPRRARPDRAHPAAADRRPQRRRAHRRGAGHARWARPSATRCGSPTRWATRTLVKLMTDGVLLAEIQRDRLLRQYDTIILDEAHERSLNIDFLLGYLAQILPRRPDLKLVITSATIDVERVAAHFSGRAGRRGQRPHVPGRGALPPGRRPRRPGRRPRPGPGAARSSTPSTSWSPRGRATSWCSSPASGRSGTPQDALAERGAARTPRSLPLYSRLSAADQHKVFAPHTGRRIVLATNVAETSLTVPGIRYVIDPGTARISRYSHRTKVQRLPIEPVSQASARQRSGRCGRLGPGIAIRLYTRGRLRRPARSSPTPRSCAPTWPRCCCRWPRWTSATSRTSRSSTRRTAAPSPTAWRCWRSCGALDADGKLTATGRALAALPLDPRIARMVVEADRRGVLEEVLVIAAGPDHPGPARAPGRAPAGRRRAARAGSPTRTPTSSRCSTCGATWASSRTRCRATSSAARSSASSCTTCASASGRTCTASSAAPPAGWA